MRMRNVKCHYCVNNNINKASLRSHKTRSLLGKKYSEIMNISNSESIEDHILDKDCNIKSLTPNEPESDDKESV